jgi:hypothetical protein
MNGYENNCSEELRNVSVGPISGHEGPHVVCEMSQEEKVAENEENFGLIVVAAGVRLISLLLNLKNSLRKPTHY